MGTEVINYREQLAKEAKELGSRIAASQGEFIRVTDKQFKLPSGEVTPGPLNVVILEFVSGNFYYDRPYRDGEVTPPACFAQGLDPRSLVPNAASPDKQAENCNDCVMNEFGSKGAGKACQNNRILAVVEPSGDPEAPIYFIKVSPTATRDYDSYVAAVRDNFGVPPVGVVTTLTFDPATKYPKLKFGDPTPNENVELHFTRRQGLKEKLLTPPDVSAYEAPPAAKATSKKR